MNALDDVFAALAASAFRQRFRLGPKEQQYRAARTPDELAAHARRIVDERLAPAHPKNDGKQTPMRGHPVFIAQHATATCCRGCLAKWHAIPEGRELNEDERAQAVAAILRWLANQPCNGTPAPKAASPQLKLPL